MPPPRALPPEVPVPPSATAELPPKVEYCLTEWGQSLCPALDALLTWAAGRPQGDAEEERDS